MKKIALIFCLSLLTMTFAASVFAQDNSKKDELFGKIAKMSQTKKSEDQDKAYQLSKDYLTQYGSDNDEKTTKVKEYVEKYRASAINKKLDDGKTAEAFALGKEILTQEPDNSYVTMNLAYGGYEALTKKKDKSFADDSINYARKTLSLFEAGKLPKTFQPFNNQAEATALMYYVIGSFQVDDQPQKASENFYKSLQYESKIKNNAYPYYMIAYNYEQQYAKDAKDFQAKYGNQAQEDSAMKADNAKLEKLLNRMLDAYARTVKVAQAENNPNTAAWKQRYNEIYKFVKQSDAGADEYLNNVASTPMPDPNAV